MDYSNDVSRNYFRASNSGRPLESVNYPKNDLHSIRKIDFCDTITNHISHIIGSNRDSYNIHIINPLAGEQIMSFVETRLFNEIYVYMCSSPYVDENIKYSRGESGSATVHIVPGSFNGIPSYEKNTILYIDSLWDKNDTNQEFQFQSLKINDKTLEYWIEVSKQCKLIVINIPPTYILKSVGGFSYDNILVHDDEGKPIMKTCYIIPLSHEDWINDLKEYIKLMLNLVEIKNVDRYLTSKHMRIWSDAFTHKSVSRSNNYEEYEIIGDTILKSHMTLYLFEKYPSISAHYITGLRNYYLTKHYMPIIARKYNMIKYIRSVKPINQDMLEDVLESFFGALYIIGSKISSCSFGTTKKMADYIFDNIDIDMSKGEGDAKSIVRLRTFQRLHLDNPSELLERDGKLQCMSLTVDETSIAFFKNKNIHIIRTIGVGYGYTKTIASDTAYNNALIYLRKKNINEKFVQITTESMKFGSIDGYNGVRTKYLKEGYVGIKVKPEISSQGKTVPLIATDDFYSWDYILATCVITGECEDNEIFKRLFQMYLTKNDIHDELRDISLYNKIDLFNMCQEADVKVTKKTSKQEMYKLLQDHNSLEPL